MRESRVNKQSELEKLLEKDLTIVKNKNVRAKLEMKKLNKQIAMEDEAKQEEDKERNMNLNMNIKQKTKKRKKLQTQPMQE